MAKWGEGDPRWIVEERPDATNVNNWHWTEKNATEWSKQRMKELLEKMVIDDEKTGRCEITTVSEMTGEAYLNNRKSKLIVFYEWQLELEWKGNIAGKDSAHEGKIKIPNFSEEYTVKEVDVEISVKGSSPADEQLKSMLKTKGTPLIKKKLETYLKELREEYSKDVILPTKGAEKPNSVPVVASPVTPKAGGDEYKKPVGVKIATQDLELSEEFHCTADDMYRALTMPEMVFAFTRSAGGTFEPDKGGKFSLFNGHVTGENIDLVKNEKLVQKWRFKSWPDAHFSVVTITIKQNDSGTTVHLKQTGIPSNDFARTKEGWKNYYWDSLKATFGFGALLT